MATKIKMNTITQSCVLLLWMLALVKSQDCTLEQFINGPLFDANFDTSNLDASYSAGRQVRVGCNVGFSGFFKLICVEGRWQSRGTVCEPRSCGHPGDAGFADFHLSKGDDFVFGSQVVYTCHRGYQMVSRSNLRRCMSDGWDGVVPVCEARRCNVIHVGNNVQVNGDREEATYGNVVRFSCKSNSEILSGSSEMYCDENGEWSGSAPKCIVIKCETPNIENGEVTGENRDYKEHEILQFGCNRKYVRSEPRPSTCTKVGTRAEWSPTPVCEASKCRVKLPLPEGTRYEPAHQNVFLPGETLRVTCGDQYWISDTLTTTLETTCGDDGEWSVRPVCQVVTCRNQRDPNVYRWSVYWGQVIRLGDTARYSCRSGYKTTGGSDVAECTRQGWMPNPLCQEILCNRPEVENADVRGVPKEKYRNNEQVSFTCHDGYRGAPYRDCGKNGWTGNSECRELKCNRHDYSNADIDGAAQATYRHNDRVEYVCKDGYEGRFTLTCESGQWTGRSQCTSRRCVKLDVVNANIMRNIKETYSHNERVHYTCKVDNEKFFAVTCEHGTWTGIQICPACPRAEVSHGFVVGPLNDTAYFTCDSGYKLFTKGWWGEATCKDHVWSGLEECIEERKCGEIPVIPNSGVTHQRRSYAHGERVQVTCKEGFQCQVDSLTCSEGKWTSDGVSLKVICTPAATNCRAPPKVDNAVVTTSYMKEYLSESEVTYKCRDTYAMEGENTLRCTNGEWETKDINCTKILCNRPEVENADVDGVPKGEYRNNERVYFTCHDGYRGAPNRVCGKNGWTGNSECTEILCNRPEVENADVRGVPKEKYRNYDRVYFTCHDGYRGAPYQVCGENGWTGNSECTVEPLGNSDAGSVTGSRMSE